MRKFGLDGAIIAAVALIGTGATAATTLTPRPDAQIVAVMFAPWTPAWQAMASAAAAGGRIVGFGRVTSIVLVAPDHLNYARDVVARGAWLVADAARGRGCIVPEAN